MRLAYPFPKYTGVGGESCDDDAAAAGLASAASKQKEPKRTSAKLWRLFISILTSLYVSININDCINTAVTSFQSFSSEYKLCYIAGLMGQGLPKL